VASQGNKLTTECDTTLLQRRPQVDHQTTFSSPKSSDRKRNVSINRRRETSRRITVFLQVDGLPSIHQPNTLFLVFTEEIKGIFCSPCGQD